MFYKVASIKYVCKNLGISDPIPPPLDRMSVVLFVHKIGLFLDLATKINFIMSFTTSRTGAECCAGNVCKMN